MGTCRNNKTITMVVLSLLIVLVAGLTYSRSAYTPFTLVLQVKSLAKGEREIVVTSRGDKELRIPFELVDDRGGTATYTIELPRELVKSIVIPPLAPPGRFEVESITLSNEEVAYRWNGSDECRMRLSSNPIGSYSPCTGGAPTINAAADTSVVIANIPSVGVRASLVAKTVQAGLATGLLLLCSIYLLRPVQTESIRAEVYVERVAWVVVMALYLWQLLLLWRYAVDLPFWEEWEFFEPAALQRGLTLDWLFAHFGTNQQVVVFTKLMAWLDFKLFSLDFTKLKLMNYLVFGLFLLTVTRFARQVTDNRFRHLPFFLLFLVSPLAYEAHAASFQSGEIFVLLFSLLMLCQCAPEKPGVLEAGLFSAAALGAIFSMHTGVAVAGILLVGRSVFILSRMLSKTSDTRDAVISLVISCLITSAGLVFWFSGFRNPTEASVRLMPTEGRFWWQFFDLLSYGCGFDGSGPLPGLIILVGLLVPLMLLLGGKQRWQGSTWQVLLAIAVLLAIVAMITFGRGATFTTLRLSRYTVYISPLIPLGALAWWLALRENTARTGVMAGFWLFFFAAFSNNWNYAVYRDLRQMDLASLECVEAYNSGRGDGNCPDTHGVPIGGFFDNARKLDIHFTRQFSRHDQPK